MKRLICISVLIFAAFYGQAQVPARQIKVKATEFTVMPDTLTNVQAVINWLDTNMGDNTLMIEAASNALRAVVINATNVANTVMTNTTAVLSNQVKEAEATFCTNGFLAFPSEIQPFPINASTDISFLDESYDNGPGNFGEFNASVFTPAANGYWLMGGTMELTHLAAANPTNRMILAIYKNTVLYQRIAERAMVTNTTISTLSGETLLKVTAGEAYKLVLVTEGDKAVTNNTATSRIWGMKMRKR